MGHPNGKVRIALRKCPDTMQMIWKDHDGVDAKWARSHGGSEGVAQQSDFRDQ